MPPNSQFSILNSQFVKATALDIGFDACGLAEAGPVDPEYLADYDGWLARGGNAGMDFLVRHRDLRSHPANLLPGARTVICVLLSYKSDALIHTSTPSHLHTFPLVAQYSYPPDYHDRLRHLLHTLAARLREAYPGMECRPCVDSAPLPEKYWAVRAGLGWRGRNTLLVNPTFGTFCNLGELLVTLPADRYDTPLPNGCPPTCHACLTACPNGALTLTHPSVSRVSVDSSVSRASVDSSVSRASVDSTRSSTFGSPNLGEQPRIHPASDPANDCASHSSPKLGEVAQRAGGVCETPALTHSSVSRTDSSPNLGEQPRIPPASDNASDNASDPANDRASHSSPKLGEVAQRAGGVCETPALTHSSVSRADSSPNLGEQPRIHPASDPANDCASQFSILNFQFSILEASRCTAYHTIENRDAELPADLDTAGYAFGCDRCQLACPYNRAAPARYHLTPARRAELESLATADEEQFRRITRGTPMSRIKYFQWLRNLRHLTR